MASALVYDDDSTTAWPPGDLNTQNETGDYFYNDTIAGVDVIHVYHSPVIIACSFAIGIIGIISNGFVLLVIGSSKKMKRRVSNLFIANQSLIDLTCSLTLIAYSTVQDTALEDTLWNRFVCEVWISGGVFWGVVLVSTWNLMVLTLERYTSIVYPVWHTNHVNRSKVACAVVCVWLLPIGQCLLEATLTTDIVDGHCKPYSVWASQTARRIYGIFILIGYNILPLVCFVVCYTKMALVIREKARRMMPPSATSESVGAMTSQITTSVTTTTLTATTPLDNIDSAQPELSSTSDNEVITTYNAGSNKNNNQLYMEKHAGVQLPTNPWSKAKRNILITLAWVSALYVICWTPQGVYFFIINMTGKTDFVSDFNNFAILMIYLNCCVNPFVYLAKYELFRQSARALFYNPVTQQNSAARQVRATGGGSEGAENS